MAGRYGLDPSAPMSAPGSTMPDEGQQFSTPRRGHSQRQSGDFRIPSNAASMQYTPQHAVYQDPQYANGPPVFDLQQATPRGSQASSVVPSNAGIPGALHPGGSSRSAYTTPMTVPSMQQAQQYAPPPQPLSRANTQHSHSRSSPAGMADASQRYVPFNASTPSQTPLTSNPKAYNLSHATAPPAASIGPSHSPLNLTDIRSRAVSDANEGFHNGGTGTPLSYSGTPTNSNYLAPFPAFAYDWCKWPIPGSSPSAGKMAIGSYLEDPHNFIQILDTAPSPQEGGHGGGNGGPAYGLEYTKIAEATCAYPVTRILWEPPSSQKSSTDLLATSGDHLRLWSLPQSTPTPHPTSSSLNRSALANTRDPTPQKLQPLALLSNSKTPEHTAPLTSLDWNTLSPKLIITSSIDTTCTIWDIPTLTAKTQLIAHDKEVFDVRFCAGSVDVFVSCGADGSVRMFDLRSLEHSTIIYEPAEKGERAASPDASSPTKPTQQTLAPSPPLLRLAASPHDAHLLATFASDSNLIRILDVRQPGTALLELRGHAGALNSIEWNPNRRGMLASGGDDSLVLVWDLLNAGNRAPGGGGGTAGMGGVNGGAAGSALGGAPAAAAGAGQAVSEVPGKGPLASWRCEYEVANVSWAPASGLTGQGGEWLGVCAGRGIWGVKL
ncbi:hypothetical protein LTR53_006618 [Teratosphaeriaceae sp. CCFEE 6253]|nr:hypothetical protein LTR53_006618 [Teratosphaeriaceae sp. CCFEE 6253]